MAQKDQKSVVPNPTLVPPKYVAQQTLQYKTFLKRTMTEALQNAFGLYEDKTLAKTKIGPDYQTGRANFPSVVVKFYEQKIVNAGVGHMEWGPDNDVQILTGQGNITNGSGLITGLATVQDLLPGITEIKGNGIHPNSFVRKVESESSILISQPAYETRETTLSIRGELDINEKFIEYHHSIYHGDIALEVYGMSSVDRDKVADALVEVVQMGTVGEEGLSFQERIYNTIGLSPYSKWHFIAVNTDLLSGYGEREELAPWMPEDTWVYRCEYRVPILGEFYSITPKSLAGTLGLVQRVKFYPWNTAGISDEPQGQYGEVEPNNFPEGVIPDEDYYFVPPIEIEPQGELYPKLNLYPDRHLYPHKGPTEDLFPRLDLFPDRHLYPRKLPGEPIRPRKGLFPRKGLHPRG